MDEKKPKFDLKAIEKSFKSFDIRSLQKFTSAQATEDLNAFLEKLPQHAGQTMLIIAGVVWGCAGGVGLFATVQMQKVTELRAQLEQAQAAQPMVPEIVRKPVDSVELKQYIEKTAPIYSKLEIKASGSKVSITANAVNLYGRFREAVGHVQNGGNGWSVSIDKLCVGRECDRHPLAASLTINTVSVKRAG